MTSLYINAPQWISQLPSERDILHISTHKHKHKCIVCVEAALLNLETMDLDDSFKKPGAVPFKWEIKPGVPKPQQQQQCHNQPNHSPKLRPPPSRSFVFSPEDPWTRPTPVLSDKWRFDRSNSLPTSCFLSPLLPSGKMNRKAVDEPDYKWDLRRSLSLGKCYSPLGDSMSSSSSVWSNRSSPRPVRNDRWTGFGPLFLSFVTGSSGWRW